MTISEGHDWFLRVTYGPKWYPILFSGPMVRAILSGTKTQTRRLSPRWDRLQVGDRLWCKETWQAIHVFVDPETGLGDDIEWAEKGIPKDDHRGWWSAVYDADGNEPEHRDDRGFPWRPSIYMPRWASRITLEVTAPVRVEPLQDITEEDANWEGVHRSFISLTVGPAYEETERQAFARLWDHLHGKKTPWSSNPEVRVISFRRVP